MVTDEDLSHVIEFVYERSGYDFSDYSRASLHRRVIRLMEIDGVDSTDELAKRLTAKDYMRRFVEEVTVNLTEMFRDPPFYKSLVNDIFPELAARPHIRIWHAGCSTGEEVYSVAILLHECGLLSRTRQYATDLNPEALERARRGMFPMEFMRTYSRNYLLSGGSRDFSSYYVANYSHARFHTFLGDQVTFSTHNLVSDRSFNVFDLIVCRNVLIYFNKNLQESVFRLFDDSLEAGSYLALGSRETIKYSSLNRRYRPVSPEKIWQKM